MRFIGENKIETSDGRIIESNILENVNIAAKSNRKTLRTTMISYLMLGLKGSSYSDIKNFFSNDVNDVVSEYVKNFAPSVNFEYLKDLDIKEFEYSLENLRVMDISYQKIHEIAIEQVNKYSNDEIFHQIL